MTYCFFIIKILLDLKAATKTKKKLWSIPKLRTEKKNGKSNELDFEHTKCL